MLLYDIASLAGAALVLWFAGYLHGYLTGQKIGIEFADHRNEMERRQHMERVIAELDAGGRRVAMLAARR